MTKDTLLSIIRQHPEGIWIRELARKARVSPASVCNHLYGYTNSQGTRVPPSLFGNIEIEHLGQKSLTLIKPK